MKTSKLPYASPELSLISVADEDVIRTSEEGVVLYDPDGSGNIQDW